MKLNVALIHKYAMILCVNKDEIPNTYVFLFIY